MRNFKNTKARASLSTSVVFLRFLACLYNSTIHYIYNIPLITRRVLFSIAAKVSRVSISAVNVLTANVTAETNKELSNFSIGPDDDLAVWQANKSNKEQTHVQFSLTQVMRTLRSTSNKRCFRSEIGTALLQSNCHGFSSASRGMIVGAFSSPESYFFADIRALVLRAVNASTLVCWD